MNIFNKYNTRFNVLLIHHVPQHHISWISQSVCAVSSIKCYLLQYNQRYFLQHHSKAPPHDFLPLAYKCLSLCSSSQEALSHLTAPCFSNEIWYFTLLLTQNKKKKSVHFSNVAELWMCILWWVQKNDTGIPRPMTNIRFWGFEVLRVTKKYSKYKIKLVHTCSSPDDFVIQINWVRKSKLGMKLTALWCPQIFNNPGINLCFLLRTCSRDWWSRSSFVSHRGNNSRDGK